MEFVIIVAKRKVCGLEEIGHDIPWHRGLVHATLREARTSNATNPLLPSDSPLLQMPIRVLCGGLDDTNDRHRVGHNEIKSAIETSAQFCAHEREPTKQMSDCLMTKSRAGRFAPRALATNKFAVALAACVYSSGNATSPAV
jgi:hypothetical protein